MKRILTTLALAVLVCIGLLVGLWATGFIQVYHLTSGYRYLDTAQRAQVTFAGGQAIDLDKELAQANEQGRILCVRGKQLREAINRKEKALVYIFNDGCMSPGCLPLSVVADYAKQIHAAVYFVATDLRPSLFLHPEPILSVDFHAYGTNWYTTFLERFTEELLEKSDEEEFFNLALFESGKLVRLYTTHEIIAAPPRLK